MRPLRENRTSGNSHQANARTKGPFLSLISLLTKRTYWFHDALQAALEPNGAPPLTRAQAFVIANMATGETKASNIARNLGVSRQAISQILSELSAQGIVAVTENPGDRRSRVAKLRIGFDDDGEICTRIIKALEDELETLIGPRRLSSLYDALEGEWGEPPQLGALPSLKEAPKHRQDHKTGRNP